MIHTFQITEAKKTTSLTFYDDSKLRRIIFTLGTPAYIDFMTLIKGECYPHSGGDELFKDAVQKMRKAGYKFMHNINNKSIFRPVLK
jgi:hypothetical protein